ncbi:MAG: hypothetical protein EOO13_05170 [Chitinophagaceae bacterium]|nr:MAG: hypothetical protein EOO13_05170 [Chitinophagaceae bacterium]
MGIGRREFLRLTALALGGLVIDPRQSVVTNQDAYVNKKLGILFYKPDPWGFMYVKDFGKLRDGQILAEGWDTAKDLIWKELGDPIVIATKYYEDLPEYNGIFSPTITLNVTPKSELEDMNIRDYDEFLGMSEYGTSRLLKNFTVVKRYEPYTISGCRFYEFDAEYLFEHIDLKKPLMAELKSIKAEHNGFYYDFNCHQSAEQNQIATIEFEEFKQSIKLI